MYKMKGISCFFFLVFLFSRAYSFQCPSYSVTDTAGATRNVAVCLIHGCGGDQITASVCASFTGDTFLRLYNADSVDVDRSDDSCGMGSALVYYIPVGTACQVYTLNQGQYSYI